MLFMLCKRVSRKKHNKVEKHGATIEAAEVLMIVTSKNEKKVELERVENEERVMKSKDANENALSEVKKKQDENWASQCSCKWGEK